MRIQVNNEASNHEDWKTAQIPPILGEFAAIEAFVQATHIDSLDHGVFDVVVVLHTTGKIPNRTVGAVG
jgi:hypothetical protein